MTSYLKHCAYLLIASIQLCAVHAVRADEFSDGIAAHDRGDYVTAMKLLRPLAEQGDAAAQTGLGFMYNLGQGVAQDDLQAANWFRKAAGQGNAMAQSGLGFLYQSGQGVTQNFQEAVSWYRLAADQGLAIAQAKLGALYQNGDGVPQNTLKAYLWLSLAASEVPEAAQMLDDLAKHMSIQQISEAKAAADKCRVSVFKDCD